MMIGMLLFAAMTTVFGDKVTPENAWRDYPRPQMVRDNWTCLNGQWDYAVTKVVKTPGRPEKGDGKITVPFAIESKLSGVGRLIEPDEYLWYTRKITCKATKGRRTLLHFDGVDFRTMVFIGHREVENVPHEGGQNAFTLDITDYVTAGENELTVCVWDPTEAFINSRGKQSFRPSGCFYTRTTGIWQSVWMEEVPDTYINSYKVTPDIDKGTVDFSFDVSSPLFAKSEVTVEAAGAKAVTVNGKATLKMPKGFKLWSPESPNLYNFTASCGQDVVKGYFGMRKFAKEKDANGILRFYLNNEPYFILGTLDQGWWPDGLLTPPSEEAMKYDIQVLKDCGFNMMRKHIKVEPMRYYYLCDTMGILLLQDMPSGNGDPNSPFRAETVKRYHLFRQELKEEIDALYNVPSIVMWIPYNEGWSQHDQFLTHTTLDWVKAYDPSRLVNGPSGWCDFEGGNLWDRGDTQHLPEGVCEAADVVDMHNYRGPGMHKVNPRRISFLGEFGGLGHPVSGHLWKEVKGGNWGYGGIEDTKTREGLEKTYLGLMDRLAGYAVEGLAGSVYTQTTDVEIEINGFMTYDRKVLKFDAAKIRAAHERVVKMAYEAAKCKKHREQVTAKLDPNPKAWAWTTQAPAGDWFKAAYNDADWKRSAGGFGNKMVYDLNKRAKYVTEWTTERLWVRRHFNWKKPNGKVLAAVLEMFHDEDATVYLNGQKILSVPGYNGNWDSFRLDVDAFNAAVKTGDNVIAVEIKQTVGGQYFDLGLAVDLAD